MTTCVYKDGWMATDSALTDAKKKYIGSTQKLFRLKSGALYASCGDGDDRELRDLLQDVHTPSRMPRSHELMAIKGDIEALLVFKTGEVWYVMTGDSGSAEPVQDKHYAIGSGRYPAYGALDAFDKIPNDWSTERKVRAAVNIAIDRDVFSRGPLQVMKL